MYAKPFVFWEVDAQVDFMLPGGKLYVPGAEKIIPNISRLVQTALQNHFLLVSSADAHAKNDPEFKTFPPHCVAGTTGAEIIPEGLGPHSIRIPSEIAFRLPEDILQNPQIILEKQHLDVFTSPHASELVDLLPNDVAYVVFGVVTEFCVKCAAEGLLQRGRKVHVVSDAIETLSPEVGRSTLAAMQSLGAIPITTSDVLSKTALAVS
jgi:nicotinamidase/pyrazinamidase